MTSQIPLLRLCLEVLVVNLGTTLRPDPAIVATPAVSRSNNTLEMLYPSSSCPRKTFLDSWTAQPYQILPIVLILVLWDQQPPNQRGQPPNLSQPLQNLVICMPRSQKTEEVLDRKRAGRIHGYTTGMLGAPEIPGDTILSSSLSYIPEF